VSSAESSSLCGNLEEILTFQQGLCAALEECSKMPEGQQRLGGCYLNMMCQIRMLYLSYCSSHPSAVAILTDHRLVLATWTRVIWSQGYSGKRN
ncbi:rho guanine nucleotide exchange factor 6 isoform X1, partial [Tachysurus ichikawai]